jgi:hypothetical protein
MIAAAEVGNGRTSSVIKENLQDVAARDFEKASAGIPHCICRIGAPGHPELVHHHRQTGIPVMRPLTQALL